MSRLLDPLTPDQQWLVDLVAEAYINDGGQWPIFDYLEATFDAKHKVAWEALYTLPWMGQWHYGAAWWVGMNVPDAKPSAEAEIELTILGMHRSASLQDRVPIFLTTLRYMVELQRNARPSTRQPRRLELDARRVQAMISSENRVPLEQWSLDHLPTLWRREPATWAGGESRDSNGVWKRGIPRTVLDYDGVSTIEEYIDRLEALTAIPSATVVEAAPSPLSLVSALDYLDMAWRVAYGAPLFSYPSAERAAKLAYAATTTEELDSRLTGLGEILRTANVTVRHLGGKLAKQTHEEPLAPLRDFLGQRVGNDRGRVGGAVTTLEAALSVRDATQHTEAGGRAVMALTQEFSLAHPIRDPADAWVVIASRVVTALTTIREELVTHHP
jgi:hypothetical protein